MSQPDVTNVDITAVKAAIGQLSALSTSLKKLSQQVQDAADLTWTGADDDGIALYEQLAPAERNGLQAVADAQAGVDGLINGLGTTAGLWNSTEGVNVEMSQ